MSKKSALMVYQNLKNITEEKEYWDKYIKFHEPVSYTHLRAHET